jgi:anthranilate synthase/aminodeoxychorismate synthase-like glutamine amidotransferase
MHVLLLDNYDSFTYNLYDYLLQTGCTCEVHRNDAPALRHFETLKFDAAVLSPGPKRPADAGRLLDFITHFFEKKPLLGVCLGHQALGEFFGSELTHARLPMHGKTSEIRHDERGVFARLPNPLSVMRYHSLILREPPAGSAYQPVARTAEGDIMASRHAYLPICGVQFHPESILTEHGLAMLQNWVRDLEVG